MRTTTARRQAWANADNTALANGLIRFYDGTRPAGPNSALAGNTLLATLTGSATFGVVSVSGTDVLLTANAITADTAADANGTATFARLFASDGTTAIMDLSVGTSAAEIILNTLTFSIGLQVSMSGLVVTYALGA
jgi:hypothetical protein